MKNIWKWMLGILAVVVLLAALAGAGFLWQRHADYAFSPRTVAFERSWDGPMMRGHHDFFAGPMSRGFDRFHGPMMGGRSFGYDRPFDGAFFPLFGLIRLVPLTLLVLVLVVAYQMGKRAGVNSVTHAPQPAPVETKPARTPRKKTS